MKKTASQIADEILSKMAAAKHKFVPLNKMRQTAHDSGEATGLKPPTKAPKSRPRGVYAPHKMKGSGVPKWLR